MDKLELHCNHVEWQHQHPKCDIMHSLINLGEMPKVCVYVRLSIFQNFEVFQFINAFLSGTDMGEDTLFICKKRSPQVGPACLNSVECRSDISYQIEFERFAIVFCVILMELNFPLIQMSFLPVTDFKHFIVFGLDNYIDTYRNTR